MRVIFCFDIYFKPKNQASDGRDALAKFLFDRMFEWLIYRINVELAPKEAASKNFAFIGVLDIFGFEIFSGTVALAGAARRNESVIAYIFQTHIFRS